ncbi:hypothetical protein EUX98_g1830 [Antrodiella citrinella]|uniref:DUF6593 domain-containing protein n=1 Tax=Antrodiella citrinella TaxID=2447956 RepID=A0A4S4N1Y7_9APHY|nr:hypothetical protein EUX98_g1830 [Antrodiella citrinella]
MELHLARDDFTRTILHTGGDAKTPLYHINTPSTLTNRVVTISRILSAAADQPEMRSGKESDIKAAAESKGIEEVARIEWRDWHSSSNLIFEGLERRVNDFMPTSGMLGVNRTFTGPDGLSYNWHDGRYLYINRIDNPKFEIARFHQPWSFRKKPYLTIAPEGMHMVDLIVVTWLYVATRTREQSIAVAAVS